MVYALGLGDELIAVSHDCDFPPDVANKTRLTSIDIAPSELDSRKLDDWVSSKVHKGISIYHIDPEILRQANPELILTQELCEVCAPSFSDVESACRILDGKPRIVSLEPTGLAEILENILRVGKETGREEQAMRLVASLRKRIDSVESAAKAARHRPSVLCVEWIDPIFIAGHWVPEMVQLAGGVDGLGRIHRPSTKFDWARIQEYDPDLIVLMPCGFDLGRTMKEARALDTNRDWRTLRAVRNQRVFAVNGSAYFNRPGPRIVEGLEILAEILHPEIFSGLAPANSYELLA
jgi:iron complex transport system substrate-binding protein